MRVGLMLIVVSLGACSDPPPPPPTPVAVAKPPPPPVAPAPVVHDAGVTVTLPSDTLDGVSTEGVPDDRGRSGIEGGDHRCRVVGDVGQREPVERAGGLADPPRLGGRHEVPGPGQPGGEDGEVVGAPSERRHQ